MNLGLATHFMTDDRLAQTQVVAQLRRVAVRPCSFSGVVYTWHFNHGHLLQSKIPNILEPPHIHQWTLAFASAPLRQPIWTVSFGAENSSMRITLLVSTARCATKTDRPNGLPRWCHCHCHRILRIFNCRWPWLKCQVDLPSRGGAIMAVLPDKSRETRARKAMNSPHTTAIG
eukprot:scaffold48013_cov78-Cyclotella_meneghiniana.AAC.4